MKSVDVRKGHETAYVIEQLNKLNYYQTDGLSYKELVHRLAVCRAMEIEVKSPHSSWF